MRTESARNGSIHDRDCGREAQDGRLPSHPFDRGESRAAWGVHHGAESEGVPEAHRPGRGGRDARPGRGRPGRLHRPGGTEAPGRPRRRHPIGVSTYSFWQFRGERLGIAACIDKAAAMGFDGVEILHVQMAGRVATPPLQQDQAPGPLARPGPDGLLDPPGVRHPRRGPAADQRPEDALPDRRWPTGWASPRCGSTPADGGRSSRSTTSWPSKGIEPPCEGHTEEEAFGWVDRRDREAPAPGRGVRRGARPGEPLGPGPDRRRACSGSSRRSSPPGSR